MCGIGGVLGAFTPAQLEALSVAIAHRGPDGHGTWADAGAGVALTHRRLSILDLSEHGAQPMWDADRTVVVSYNGEIYNFPALRAELAARGHRFRSQCDTEVIVAGYKEWGADVLRRLNGIFAFALWDTRRRELLLARDPAGVKPLYYVRTPTGLAFSSELKALQAAGLAGREIDPVAIAAYVSFLYSPGERTPLAGVRKLLPGHRLLIASGGEPRIESYAPPRYAEPIETCSIEQAAEELRQNLRQAVRRQMLADVPVGAFLSGGLDSSAVVAFAREASGAAPLPCFTIGFSGRDNDGLAADLPYARAVAQHLGVELEVVTAEPPAAEDLERMVWQLDEPQADPAALNTWAIAKLARERGIEVLLSGAGGDDLFSGYRRHRALQAERWWDWLPRPARQVLRLGAGACGARAPAARRLRKAFQYADAGADERLIRYFDWLPRGELPGLLGPATRAAVAAEPPVATFARALAELPPGTPALNRMLALEQRFFLADHNLNYTDKMSMAAGVETRVPLLDPDVVAFAARLPVEYKQRGAEGKWIFKRAMEGVLPREVIYRPKTGFGVPLRTWVRGGFGALLDRYLAPEVLRARGVFDPAGVTRLVELDRRGVVDAAYPLLAIACVEIWLRRYVDE